MTDATNYDEADDNTLFTAVEEEQIDENIAPGDVELVYRTQDFTIDSLISRLKSEHIIIPSSDRAVPTRLRLEKKPDGSFH